jgi:hypothetical protein
MMDPGSIDSYKEEITHYSFEQLVTKVNESNYEAIKENLSYYLALVEVVKEKRLDNGKVIMIDQRRTSD